jgi:hypothetical protein
MTVVLALSVTVSGSTFAQRHRTVRPPTYHPDIFVLYEKTAKSIFIDHTDTCVPGGWIDHNELLRQFDAAFANNNYDFLERYSRQFIRARTIR